MATLGTFNSGTFNSFIYNEGAESQTTSSFVPILSALHLLNPMANVQTLQPNADMRVFNPQGEVR